MRVLFFGNNRVASQILPWLLESGVEIVGVAVHPAEQQTFGSEILSIAEEFNLPVIEAPMLRLPAGLATVRKLAPDIGLSISFGYMLLPELLRLHPRGVINLHPSLLPYNRGANPNVWSIVDGTPAGVSLHYIDAGVDTGDLIAQRQVPVDAWDTGLSLYGKLEEASVELFKATWPAVRNGNAPRTQQPQGGSSHRREDVKKIDLIDLDHTYTGRDLLAILRARSFPPYRNAYFVDQGRKIYLCLQTDPE